MSVYEHMELVVTPRNTYTYAPLLMTCREARNEASSIFYGENTFRVIISPYDAGRLLRWLRAIGHEEAGWISRLQVEFVLSDPTWRLSRTRRALGWAHAPATVLAEFDRRVVDKFAREIATVVLFRWLKANAVVADNASSPPDWSIFSHVRNSLFITRAAEAFQERIDEESVT